MTARKRKPAKPRKVQAAEEVIVVSDEDFDALKEAIDNPPEPTDALKALGRKVQTAEEATLKPHAKRAAEEFIESLPIQAIPIPARFLDVMDRHFGEPHLMPRCYRGALNACRHNRETGEIQLILTLDASEEDFMHEYAHYMAFHYCPGDVYKVSDTINETFAQLMVERVLHKRRLGKPADFVIAFYAKMVRMEGE